MSKTLESTATDLKKLQASMDSLDYSDTKEAELLKQSESLQAEHSKVLSR